MVENLFLFWFCTFRCQNKEDIIPNSNVKNKELKKKNKTLDFKSNNSVWQAVIKHNYDTILL